MPLSVRDKGGAAAYHNGDATMNVHAETKTQFKPPVHAAVWFEIPVTDMERAKKFYSAVLGTEFTDSDNGPNPMSVFGYSAGEQAVSGHLYAGKPAGEGSGPTIHLAVADDVATALERLEKAGGKVVSPVIEIPAGRFAYCLDPDGNSIGLFSR
jgi:uncharacterized protein